jgi:hypothetical protein
VKSGEIERVAAAVLYEGYLLYPYRLSVKNVRRWTFGTVAPRLHAEASGEPEKGRMECQVLLEGDAPVQVKARFLHVQERTTSGSLRPAWQEGIEREVSLEASSASRLAGHSERTGFRMPAAHQREAVLENGRMAGEVHRWTDELSGILELSAIQVREGLFRLDVKIVNKTGMADSSDASEAERRSFMACHAIVTAEGGRFVSLTDPPPDKADDARACRHTGWWPVLVGDPATADAMLCSPIILPDHPRVAEESPGDLFDGTEIDEILSLRIRTLTDDEKREMASIDPRARAILERTEALARRELQALHGTWRRFPETRHDAR